MQDKLIIFDWGGVVERHKEGKKNTDQAWIDTIRDLGAETENSEKFFHLLEDANILPNGRHVSEVNDRSSLRQWVLQLFDVFHIKYSVKQSGDPLIVFGLTYLKNFSDISYYQEIVQYIHSLKGSCKLAVLSNLLWFDKERLDAQMNLVMFDYVWLSFEMHKRKPDDALFAAVEQEAQCRPENILFVDDTLINTKVACERGWQVCHIKEGNLSQIQTAVDSFLLQKTDAIHGKIY